MLSQQDSDEDEGDVAKIEELREAMVQLSDLHTGLSDCYRSLDYLEKFFKVSGRSFLTFLFYAVWDIKKSKVKENYFCMLSYF